MGQIVLSGHELVCILTANARLPDQVMGVETDGDEIKVHVATPLPLVHSLAVRVRFAGFEQGQIVLQLVTNRLLDKFEWLVNRMLAGLQIEEHGGRWEYPRLYVDVNRLLRRQIRGVEIADVAFKDAHFHITTVHVADPTGERPPAPQDAASSRRA